MRYGFCTGFASNPPFGIDATLEALVGAWGYDYIELPLMSIVALSEDEFTAMKQRIADAGLACDSACNLFPGSVPVIGENVSEKVIRDYLDVGFTRAKEMGVKKLIFGSAGARKLGSYDKEKADVQFLSCLGILEEYCTKYDMEVLIECIRRGEADYINTLAEGAAMAMKAQDAGYRHILLMADLFHMNCNGEPISDFEKYLPIVHHVHVCDVDREIPVGKFNDFLSDGVKIIKRYGYDRTVSYEAKRPADMEAGKAACALLKSYL